MSDVPYSSGNETGFHMRPSRILRTIADGKVAKVLKMNTADATVAECFAQSGIDALWLCQEHVPTSHAEIQHIVRTAKIHDVDTLVRVARGGYSDYIRPLEVDATGLVVPHVMDSADAATVRDMTKFAPIGRRALDGGNADGGFTRVELLDYLKTANEQRVILHQVEDPSALDDIEAMAALPGVDGLFFGPGDFSVAIGQPGEIMGGEVQAARVKVAEVARRHGKIAATVGGPAMIGDLAAMGYNLLSVGADVVALNAYADSAVKAFGDL